MRKQVFKTVKSVMTFVRGNAKMCVCRVDNGIGYDAFNDEYSVVTDDFGNVVFVSFDYHF